MAPGDKPLVWLHGEVKTPPFGPLARLEAGVLLRRSQRGERLGMPQSRPMPGQGPRCHELRSPDAGQSCRLMYRLDPDAVVIIKVFGKKTSATPPIVLDTCRRRLRAHDAAALGTEDP